MLGKRDRDDDVGVDHQVDPPSASRPAAVVQLSYRDLPSDSWQKLDECLQEWRSWHVERYSGPTDSYDLPKVLSGSLRYEPGLMRLGPGGRLAAWEEKPAAPERGASATLWFNIAYEKGNDVPTYDRALDTPLYCPDPKKRRRGQRWKPLPHELTNGGDVAAGGEEGGAGGAAGRPAKRARGGAAGSGRCFNCGSYAHSMRECWREYNKALVEQSRQEFADAKDAAGAGRSTAKRYFLAAEGGRRGGGGAGSVPLEQEFPDVQPGQLSEAMRSALGLGPGDPPPWLHRMQAMGPPPGYKIKAGRRRQLAAGASPAAVAAAAGEAAANGVAHSGEAEGVLTANGLAQQPNPAQPPTNGLQAAALAAAAAAAVAAAAAAAAAGAALPGLPQSPEGSEGLQAQQRQDSGSLESGELAEGGPEPRELLGDFLAFDDEADQPEAAAAGAAAAGLPGGEEEGEDEQEVEGPRPQLLVAEDFIPMEQTPQPSESEEEEGGEAEWENTWVYGAQFPGVNAPPPQGADPAKWAQPSERRRQQQQQQQQQGGGPPQRHTPQSAPPPAAGGLRRLQGLHPVRSESLAPHSDHQQRQRYQPSPLGGGSGGAPAEATPLQDQRSPPRQQRWQPEQPGRRERLRHMPSAPALLQQHASPPLPRDRAEPYGGAVAGEGQYSPYGSRAQEQGRYSPILPQQGPPPAMARHASLAQQPIMQHHQQQQAAPQPPPVFGVSAYDPGHILAPMAPQPPPPSQQQLAQLYVPSSGQLQQGPAQPLPPFPQQPQQQQEHFPLGQFGGGQAMLATGPQQAQQQIYLGGGQGVVEAYNPEFPAGQGLAQQQGGGLYAHPPYQQQQHQQFLLQHQPQPPLGPVPQAPLPPGFW